MNHEPPIIDMRPDGTFLPPRPGPRTGVPLSAKLMLGGIVIAAIGVSIAVAALAIWVVSMVLPVVIIAGVVAWAAMKFRRWQSLRGGEVLGPRPPSRFR